jgi:hypothetical protein
MKTSIKNDPEFIKLRQQIPDVPYFISAIILARFMEPSELATLMEKYKDNQRRSTRPRGVSYMTSYAATRSELAAYAELLDGDIDFTEFRVRLGNLTHAQAQAKMAAIGFYLAKRQTA